MSTLLVFTAGLCAPAGWRADTGFRVPARAAQPDPHARRAGKVRSVHNTDFRKQGNSSPSLGDKRSIPSKAVEAKVAVLPAGERGMGVFAAEHILEGTWIASYEGLLTTRQATDKRYSYEAGDMPDYLFVLSWEEGLEIDAQNSTHFSRFFNHHQNGTLNVQVSPDDHRIDFFAARTLRVGEELTFDYGRDYWLCRPGPTPESDHRNFTLPPLAERYPLALGTVRPLTPISAIELQAALALPEPQSRAALLRCVEYFGPPKRYLEFSSSSSAQVEMLELPFGVGTAASYKRVSSSNVSYADLQGAAAACVQQAVLDQEDPSGILSADFAKWLDDCSAELEAIRQWRAEERFATPQLEAAALICHLFWKYPEAHHVRKPLTAETVDSLCSYLRVHGDARGVGNVLVQLELHADTDHINDFLGTLEQWCLLGAGHVVSK